jgi:hypothetical protein
MTSFIELLKKEEQRLLNGPYENEKIGGLGTNRYIVRCNGDAKLVLERVKEILLKVNRTFQERKPQEQEWFSLLPDYFIYRCRPERVPEQNEWDKEFDRKICEFLQKEKRKNYKKLATAWNNLTWWELTSWIYWFEEENRYWYWWDSYVHEDSHILVAIEVHEWPYSSGNLSWLFRGCGACYVIEEPDDVNPSNKQKIPYASIKYIFSIIKNFIRRFFYGQKNGDKI